MNPRPTHYECVALPLSYCGFLQRNQGFLVVDLAEHSVSSTTAVIPPIPIDHESANHREVRGRAGTVIGDARREGKRGRDWRTAMPEADPRSRNRCRAMARCKPNTPDTSAFPNSMPASPEQVPPTCGGCLRPARMSKAALDAIRVRSVRRFRGTPAAGSSLPRRLPRNTPCAPTTP